MKDTPLVGFAKDISSPLEKRKWPNMPACHPGVLIEFFPRSFKAIG